ncbi:MAG: amphi-Trp domain-containing protein [Halobacteriota archaeon]
MPEDVLFESESVQTRAEIASYLRNVAAALDGGDPISLKAGSASETVTPPARPTFEVKVEREGPTDGSGTLSIEFELEWDEDGGDETGESGRLEIE